MTESSIALPVESGAEDRIAAVVKSPRVFFVDVLRLVASFQMVNGHTLDAVMVESIRVGSFFDRYLWFRGLVSVSFLVVAGIAFHLSTLCRFERHKSNPQAVKRRFRRASVIVLVGYLLNFPWAVFGQDEALRAQALVRGQSVDVLHCIGFSLILLELLTLLSRTRRQVIVVATMIAALLLLGAPFADEAINNHEAHPLLNWLSHQGGSPFPLFPWAGFVFVGLVLGALAFPDAGRTPFGLVMRRLGLLTALTLLALLATTPIRGLLYDASLHHPATNPRHSLEKLTAVLALLMILALFCRPIRALPRFLSALSQETLTIYTLHLLLLFYPGIALAKRFPHELELGGALFASAGMMVATLSLTYGWHRLKASRRGAAIIPRKGSSDQA